MRRKAMLAAVLGLLVVGCQSEFDRCMEVGTAIMLDKGLNELDARVYTFIKCAPNKEG